jgi:hypothetical protein
MKHHKTPAWIKNTPARNKPSRLETLIATLFLLHLAALAVILAVTK